MGRGFKRKAGERTYGGGIDKKQKSHLKEYGELHPADERDDSKNRYKKIVDVEEEEIAAANDQSSGSESDSDQEEESPFQQLLSTISSKAQHLTEDSDEDEDVEDDEEGDAVEVGNPVAEEGLSEESEGEDEDEESAGEGEEESSDEDKEDNDVEEDEEDSDKDEEDETLLKETDPFSIHFEKELAEDFVQNLEKSSPWEREETKIPALGRCLISHPSGGSKPVLNTRLKDFKKLRVKQKLAEQIRETNKELGNVELSDKESLTSLQHSLFSVMNNYQDLYYPDETPERLEEIRLVYCTHALNHILKTRSRVIAHNTKLKEKGEDVSDDHRDQGLTRPKVLIVAPFRESAKKIVTMFSSLIHQGDQSTVMNKKRFDEEFREEEESEPDPNKPEDYNAIFSGNIDDHFRIGMSVAKKTLKLYSKFYGSDIIIASPLGLRTIIGAEGEDDRDFDFLSSIEVLIFDQTDIFLMQNWDHIMHLMAHMHLQPKESHGVDFSRVRLWTLNGWSKFYRQTLIFSGVASPEINAIFNKQCQNYAGKVVVPKVFPSGSICQIVTQLSQMFMRIECPSYAQLADARFDFFVKKVLREHKDPVMARTMIYVPSYFDYVRMRNYFKKEEIDFVSICEYTKDAKLRKARKDFMRGKTHFLLYTERFHFYHRLRVRGVKHVVFYELPRYAHFYSELCNMMMGVQKGSTDNLTCHVLYAKYDAQRLAAVVGTERAGHMINSDRPVHMFVTGGT